MGALSIWHIVILAGVALLLFGGRGKISDLMGDVAKGIKSFKTGLNEPEMPSTQRLTESPAESLGAHNKTETADR